jgi:O-antigen ligase
VAAAVIAVGFASWLPVLIGVTTRPFLGYASAIILGLIVERLTGALSPVVLVAGLAASSSLVSSGVVTEETRYLPVLFAGSALGLRCAREMLRTRRLYIVPPRPVTVAAALYLGWAALTTATSIDRRLSATYVVGMLGVFVLAFWAIPNLLGKQQERELLLASLGGLAVAVAATVYLVSVHGPFTAFGRVVGDHLVGDLTVGGRATGLLFGRSSGIYLTPFEPAIVMAIGVVALLGFVSMRRGRERLPVNLSLAFTIPAILLTLDRTAWLAVAAAAAAFTVLSLMARLRWWTGAVVSLVLAVSLFALLTNSVGVNAVRPACSVPVPAGTSCPPGSQQSPESPLRGGTDLTGREYLWAASIAAIRTHPLVGYGPGTDALAIEPYLSGKGSPFKGLTSHSTWLRTAVEMGVVGLGLLGAVLVATGWIFLRQLLHRAPASRDPIQLALAASVAGLVAAMTFETFLLGGLTFSNLYVALAMGLLVLPPAIAGAPTAAKG